MALELISNQSVRVFCEKCSIHRLVEGRRVATMPEHQGLLVRAFNTLRIDL